MKTNQILKKDWKVKHQLSDIQPVFTAQPFKGRRVQNMAGPKPFLHSSCLTI
jgi:hypothetical protein